MIRNLAMMKRFTLSSVQSSAVSEYDVFNEAFKFCASVCRTQGIDSSHDEHHMARVARMTERLNELSGRAIGQDEKDVMILSAFTHDLCDHKYTDVNAGIEVIDSWLEKQPISDEQRRAICHIISTMSYSKVKKYGYPSDLGKWTLAYHHTRIADLIDAYDIDRCYKYQSHKHPDMDEREKWHAVIQVFESRVLTQKDEYILPIAPYAACIVEPLHAAATNGISECKKLL
jgi:hypothetical protein